MLTFRELKEALSRESETILTLGEDKDGGIKIVRNWGEGSPHSVAYSMALIEQQSNPALIYIKELAASSW